MTKWTVIGRSGTVSLRELSELTDDTRTYADLWTSEVLLDRMDDDKSGTSVFFELLARCTSYSVQLFAGEMRERQFRFRLLELPSADNSVLYSPFRAFDMIVSLYGVQRVPDAQQHPLVGAAVGEKNSHSQSIHSHFPSLLKSYVPLGFLETVLRVVSSVQVITDNVRGDPGKLLFEAPKIYHRGTTTTETEPVYSISTTWFESS